MLEHRQRAVAAMIHVCEERRTGGVDSIAVLFAVGLFFDCTGQMPANEVRERQYFGGTGPKIL